MGRGWSGPGAAPSWGLTAALFELLASDRELVALAAAIPGERLPALLFVASVQYVAARYPDDPFSAYFPSPGVDRQPPLDRQVAERYRAFCIDHRAELAAVWSDRVYQMNEVARCTQIALALAVLHDLAPDRRVTLIDVGSAAGLGLFPDRYGYVFTDGHRVGSPASSVQIPSLLQGPLTPRSHELPGIDERVGIDVNPIDLDEPEARAWLRACLPPEPGALTRATAAIALARAGTPNIVRGAADEVLPELLSGLADRELICVNHAYTAVFFDEAQRQRLRTLIAEHGRHRDVAWISLDPLVPLGTQARRTVHGADAPPPLVEANRRGGVFGVLSMTARLSGIEDTRLLATAHPSGTRMEWLDRSTAV